MLFTLKKVIGNMLLPLPLMLLIIGAGLALLWFSRFQKTGKIFISIGWLALLLLSLQPIADRWREAAKLIGIDIVTMPADAGHA